MYSTSGMSELTSGLEFQRTGNNEKLRETLAKLNIDVEKFKELGQEDNNFMGMRLEWVQTSVETIRKQEQMASLKRHYYGRGKRIIRNLWKNGWYQRSNYRSYTFIGRKDYEYSMQGKEGTGIGLLISKSLDYLL